MPGRKLDERREPGTRMIKFRDRCKEQDDENGRDRSIHPLYCLRNRLQRLCSLARRDAGHGRRSGSSDSIGLKCVLRQALSSRVRNEAVSCTRRSSGRHQAGSSGHSRCRSAACFVHSSRSRQHPIDHRHAFALASATIASTRAWPRSCSRLTVANGSSCEPISPRMRAGSGASSIGPTARPGGSCSRLTSPAARLRGSSGGRRRFSPTASRCGNTPPAGRCPDPEAAFYSLAAFGKNGNSFRIIASSGRAPYSQISNASACRTALPCSSPYHLTSAARTAAFG